MTPVSSTATAVAPVPFVTQLVGVLAAIYRGCRGYVVGIDGRGSVAREHAGEVARLERGLLWNWLIEEFRYALVDDVRLHFVTSEDRGKWLDLGAIWTEIARPPLMTRDRGWQVPAETIQAAAVRLSTFQPQPALIVNLGANLLAVWLLDQPARVDETATAIRLERVQHALAAAVGGRADIETIATRTHARPWLGAIPATTAAAWHPIRPAFRVPGSRNCDRGSGAPVIFEHVDLNRRCPLEAIEESIAGKPSKSGRKGRS